VAQFIALVKKHDKIDELTPAIVNEFIERIEVHAPDKPSGHRTQQIDAAPPAWNTGSIRGSIISARTGQCSHKASNVVE